MNFLKVTTHARTHKDLTPQLICILSPLYRLALYSIRFFDSFPTKSTRAYTTEDFSLNIQCSTLGSEEIAGYSKGAFSASKNVGYFFRHDDISQTRPRLTVLTFLSLPWHMIVMWAYEQAEGVTPHYTNNAAIGLRGRRLATPIGLCESTSPPTPQTINRKFPLPFLPKPIKTRVCSKHNMYCVLIFDR